MEYAFIIIYGNEQAVIFIFKYFLKLFIKLNVRIMLIQKSLHIVVESEPGQIKNKDQRDRKQKTERYMSEVARYQIVIYFQGQITEEEQL